MAKKKLELIENIGGWGFTLDAIMDGFDGVTDQDTVIIPINTYGGSVMEGTAVYNIIKGSKAKTEAHILGYAMSMGTVIASAADEVVMPENGYYMIHEPAMLEWGDADTFSNSAAFLNTIGMDAAEIYSKKTGKPVDEIRAMMKKTTWLNAKQALEMGFVDRLSEGTEINASLDPKLFKNAPEELIATQEQDSLDKKIVASLKSLLGMDRREPTDAEARITDLQAQLHVQSTALVQAQADLATAQDALAASKLKVTEMSSTIDTQLARIADLEASDLGQHAGNGADAGGEPEEKLYHKTPLSKKRRELIASLQK